MNDIAEENLDPGQLIDSKKSSYSKSFLNFESEGIAKRLQTDGFFFCEAAITNEMVDQILSEVENLPLGFNKNDVHPVSFFRQTFFSHCLAGSRSIVNLISDPFVLQICRNYLGSNFRLKCQRYYTSGRGYQLDWHTDNKTVDNKKTDINGLVFIIYLTDTYDGELQVVKGSNNWSGDSLSNDFADEELRKNYENDILSLPGPRGSIVITDTYTIHRTRRLTTKGFERKSLFFQIDDDLLHSEKIIVNTEFLPKMDAQLQTFFGIGLPSGYKSMPVSGINTLSNKYLFTLLYSSIKQLLKRLIKFLLGILKLHKLIRSIIKK